MLRGNGAISRFHPGRILTSRTLFIYRIRPIDIVSLLVPAKKRGALFLRFLLVLLVLPGVTGCVSGGGLENWKVLETPNYEVFFPPDNEKNARRTLYYLEKHRKDVNRITGRDRPEDRPQITVVKEDTGLFPNGFANSVADKIGLFTAHPGTNSVLSDYRSYDRMVAVHELTHIQQDTNVLGASRVLTNIFGNHFGPNFHSPRWLSEGVATYAESQTDQHEGRLNEGFFDAVVAGKASAGQMPSLPEVTYDHNIYPGGHFYLFGSTFIRYLSQKYGREKIGEFISAYTKYFWVPLQNLLIPRANIVPAGGMDRAAERTFGKSFSHLYEDWRKHEEEKNEDWEIDGAPVVETNRGVLSNLTAANGNLYYFRTKVKSVSPYHYRRVSHLVEYDPESEEEKVLTTFREPDLGRMQVVDNNLYFATREIEWGFQNYTILGWGGTATVKKYDLKTGDVEELFQDQVHDFVVGETGGILYARERRNEYGTELWQYHRGEREKLTTVDELVGELHRYQDRIIAVSKTKTSTWDITELDVEEGSFSPLQATAHAEKLVTVSGEYLYFRSNYEGYPAVYRRSFKTGNVQRMTDGGYASEGVTVENRFYFLSGVVDGMGLYRNNGSPASFDSPATKHQEGSEDVSLEDLDVPVTEKSAFGSNFAELVPPNRRFLPVPAAGQDALGTNRYVVNFSSGGAEVAWTTGMFRPVSVSLLSWSDFDGDEESRARAAYPLYRSLQSGLSGMTVDVETDFDEILPGAQLSFDYADHRVSLRQQIKVDAEEAYNSGITYNYWGTSGGVTLTGGVSNEFDLRRRDREFEIEEVDEEAYTNRASAELIHKLFEVRSGLWNPNFFLGDVYAGPFVDWTERGGVEKRSGGLQFKLEAGVANYRITPTIGAAFSTDEEEKFFFSIQASF